jgi:hypothetical protein
MESKRCSRCEQDLPREAFGVNRSHPSGLQTYCKPCQRAYRRERYDADPEHGRAASRRWRKRHPEKARESRERYRVKQPTWYLQKWFGITIEDYDRMLAEQGGTCANPGCDAVPPDDRRFHVDHDHACCPGRAACRKCVRGLLCSPCNQALGNARDDAPRLRGLADYLDRSRVR